MIKNLKGGNSLIVPVVIIGFIAAIALAGFQANVITAIVQADMYTKPKLILSTIDETFTMDIIVTSKIPVNVFAGDLSFNPEVLKIEKIDYNTSIADLWAERPWYHNGDGTLTFAGGTTKPGGFIGEGSLISLTFKALTNGDGAVVIEDARVLQHDGLGTDIDLAEPVDSIVTVSPEETEGVREVVHKKEKKIKYVITKEPHSTDLNGDGKQSVADLSIFMADLATGEMRSDFDEDGKVSLADLSILMNAE